MLNLGWKCPARCTFSANVHSKMGKRVLAILSSDASDSHLGLIGALILEFSDKKGFIRSFVKDDKLGPTEEIQTLIFPIDDDDADECHSAPLEEVGESNSQIYETEPIEDADESIDLANATCSAIERSYSEYGKKDRRWQFQNGTLTISEDGVPDIVFTYAGLIHEDNYRFSRDGGNTRCVIALTNSGTMWAVASIVKSSLHSTATGTHHYLEHADSYGDSYAF